jgi:hypothetical protein
MSKYAPFKARLVMGSPFDLNTTDHENKPQPDQKKHNWFMAFAVPKCPTWDAIYSTMYNEAANDSKCTAALCGQAGFNWKVEDCDAPDDPTKLGTASRPAGHMLIKFTRYFAMGPVPLYDGNQQRIVNATAVKRGDYFYISASTKFNGAATVKTNAGMYQNLDGLMFAESGEEIISEGGFNVADAFAGIQGGQVVNGGTAQAGAPVAAKPPVTPPPSTPTATVTPPPATDLVQPQVPGNATPPPPHAPSEPMWEYGGVIKTESQWEIVPGWSNGLIKVHGKIVA